MAGSLGEKLTASAAVLTFGLGLTALFTGIDQWYLVFVVGWFLVVPLLAILFEDRGDSIGDEIVEEVERSIVDEVQRSVRSDAAGDRADGRAEPGADEVAGPDDREDALDVLRERYARGELDDAEFERRVTRLLETESLEDAEALLGAGEANATDSAGAERESATEHS